MFLIMKPNYQLTKIQISQLHTFLKNISITLLKLSFQNSDYSSYSYRETLVQQFANPLPFIVTSEREREQEQNF